MSDGSITLWMKALRHADAEAAERIWQRYHAAMLQIAARQVPTALRRMADEEDVVLSAFDSLFRRAKAGEFVDFEDRDSLWRLLVTITKAKCINLIEHECRLKRGGKFSKTAEHASAPAEPADVAIEVASKEMAPEMKLVMVETFDFLFDLLPDENARSVARLKLDGHTNKEIAALVGCARATVDRRLALIRRTWADHLAQLEE